jgi:RND family efflux transporter MFP subunit
MNQHFENREYRTAFIIAVLFNVLLVFGLGVQLWRSHQRTGTAESAMQQPAATSASVTSGNPPADSMNAPAEHEVSLVPVQLSPQRIQSIGVKFGTVQFKNVSDEIRVTGNVDMDERRMSYIQVRFPGWIRKVYVDATYQYIQKGQPLFTVYSPDLVTTEREYILAVKNAQHLQNSSVAGVSSGAESLVGAAKERLQQWEVPPSEIAKLETTGTPITDLTFNSPVSGYVTEKNALPNMYVQPETRLYTVADLSTVWVYAQVFQTDVGKIKPGDSAEVTVDAYPGKIFSGRIEQILPQVDMNTRTIRVRLVLKNPSLSLKPGMYVNVLLKAPMGRQLVVPAPAVFQSGTKQLVFINHGDGNLEPKELQIASRVGDDVIVTKGLKANDSVVTSANFLIDSESQLQAAAGAYSPPPPGAGGAGGTSAMNFPKENERAKIEFSSEPSPPHKGSNLFRIHLTGLSGTAISGAQVTVTFYMPAMSAMGMAAMKTSVTLSDKGNGIYEGKGDLGSGGTWQATVLAVQNGQTVGSKQFTVNAEGGM